MPDMLGTTLNSLSSSSTSGVEASTASLDDGVDDGRSRLVGSYGRRQASEKAREGGRRMVSFEL